MRIGLDLDGVLYDFPSAMWNYCQQQDLIEPDAEMPPIDHWHFYEDFGLTGEQFSELMVSGINHAHVFWEGDLVDPKTPTILRALSSQGHELSVVTSRKILGAEIMAARATHYWLQEHLDLPWMSVTISRDKNIIPNDIFLDDNVDNLKALEAAGIIPVAWHTEYNKEWDGLRVYDMEQFYELIQDLIGANVDDEEEG